MFHLVGAIFYVLWGVAHLRAAYGGYRFAMKADAGAVQGRLLQNAWNIGGVAIAAIAVAVTLNWRNDPTGYWINLIAVSVTDIGFAIFVLLPKYMPWRPGIVGPALWILAAAFSTWGFVFERAV